MVKIIRISLYDGLGTLIFEDTVTQSAKKSYFEARLEENYGSSGPKVHSF